MQFIVDLDSLIHFFLVRFSVDLLSDSINYTWTETWPTNKDENKQKIRLH